MTYLMNDNALSTRATPVQKKRSVMALWPLALFLLLLLLPFSIEAASDTHLSKTLDALYNYVGGKLGKSIGVLAIAGAFAGWLYGKVSGGQTISVFIGVAGILGAKSIMQMLGLM